MEPSLHENEFQSPQHMLLCFHYQLESAKEQLLECQEVTRQLYHLFSIACQERDEARDQLQRLVTEISELSKFPSTSPPAISPVASNPQTKTQIPETKPNINKGSSDSPGSSSADSTSYATNSPSALSNRSPFDSCSLPPLYSNGLTQTGISYSSSEESSVDRGSMLIDNIIKGKPEPEKGKYLLRVIGAPLLETRIFLGPIPKWRNPPPMPPMEIQHSLIVGNDFHGLVSQADHPTSLQRQSSNGSQKRLP